MTVFRKRGAFLALLFAFALVVAACAEPEGTPRATLLCAEDEPAATDPPATTAAPTTAAPTTAAPTTAAPTTAAPTTLPPPPIRM